MIIIIIIVLYDKQHQQQQQQQLMYQFCKEQLAVLPVASHFKGFVRSRRGAQSMSGQGGRGRGKGRGRGRGVSDGDAMEITNALPTGLNSAHHAHMDKVRAALDARWPELSTTEPLEIKHGGSQAVFRMDSFTKALTSRGFYVAAGNATWVDLHYHPEPTHYTVPDQLRALGAFMFPHAKSLDRPVHVWVTRADADPRGSWAMKRISPNEELDCLLDRVYQDIQDGAGDVVLDKWRTILLSVTFKFELIPQSLDAWWRWAELTESIGHSFDAMFPTAPKRIMQVISYKLQQEDVQHKKISSKALAELWREKLGSSSKSGEEVTDTLIDNACTVWNRLLSIDACKDIIFANDAEHGHLSVFNSIKKLHMLCFRGKLPARITWLVETLDDQVKSKTRTSSELNGSALLGPRGGKGLLDFSCASSTSKTTCSGSGPTNDTSNTMRVRS